MVYNVRGDVIHIDNNDCKTDNRIDGVHYGRTTFLL
jgi:hypothetical protein